MARYTGPRVRISRRFGIPIFGPTKYLERRAYGPGVHGPKSRRKHTDYGLGLIEKQKLRYYYGLMEKQFRGVYEKALRRRGVTGEQMLQILETRLDNVVFHLGLANTRAGRGHSVERRRARSSGGQRPVPCHGGRPRRFHRHRRKCGGAEPHWWALAPMSVAIGRGKRKVLTLDYTPGCRFIKGATAACKSES